METTAQITDVERTRVPARAWALAAALLAGVYLVTMENGAALGGAASTLHELFHDARHLVGAPCH